MITADDIGIGGQSSLGFLLAVIIKEIEYIPDALKAGAHFVVGFDDHPGAKGCMCSGKHFFFVARVFVPKLLRLLVYRAELPLF